MIVLWCGRGPLTGSRTRTTGTLTDPNLLLPALSRTPRSARHGRPGTFPKRGALGGRAGCGQKRSAVRKGTRVTRRERLDVWELTRVSWCARDERAEKRPPERWIPHPRRLAIATHHRLRASGGAARARSTPNDLRKRGPMARAFLSGHRGAPSDGRCARHAEQAGGRLSPRGAGVDSTLARGRELRGSGLEQLNGGTLDERPSLALRDPG
ncbi:hypothetical protein DMC30DRAFT_291439 [Rhodotorula diobovata]|uniref:Uncharacterized protein n=1 Tax=Rhodotorula diobovata TaxID=5288 RepID=A0A5C5FTT7_9BASI|nr:hypothetical protein DMC30DRAFT_291439 [Rhodotorula diobovata]